MGDAKVAKDAKGKKKNGDVAAELVSGFVF